MHRRNFVKSGIAATALGTSGFGAFETHAADPRRHYELRTYELRNDINPGNSASL